MSKKISVAIIDDEPLSVSLIEKIISDYLPDLVIEFTETRPEEAVNLLHAKPVDLIFLDMDMPGMKGLEMLKLLPADTARKAICITGHEDYAVEALKAGVQDYLLKPITAGQLRDAVDLFLQKSSPNEIKQNLIDFSQKLLINRHDKAIILNLKEIMFMEADGPYTIFHLENKEKIRSSKSLGHYKLMFESLEGFISLHRSYLISFSHIREIIKEGQKGGSVVFSNGETLEFSNILKNRLIQQIEELLEGMYN